MKTITPLHDKVIGRMLDPMTGTRQTERGLYIAEDETSENFIRPRWFEVTHVGPEQQDIAVGQYVLVPHGRWSRGLDINNTRRESDFLFLLDHNDILGACDDEPVR